MVNQWPRQDRGGPGRGRKSSSPFLSRGCLSLGPREGGRRKARGGGETFQSRLSSASARRTSVE